MEGKMLGKIAIARFGFGGYDGAQIGLRLEFRGEAWGVGHFDGWWSGKRSDGAKWSEEDRINGLGRTVLVLDKLLTEAKVKDVSGLVGKPVEVEFEDNVLKGFRILTEVL